MIIYKSIKKNKQKCMSRWKISFFEFKLTHIHFWYTLFYIFKSTNDLFVSPPTIDFSFIIFFCQKPVSIWECIKSGVVWEPSIVWWEPFGLYRKIVVLFYYLPSHGWVENPEGLILVCTPVVYVCRSVLTICGRR